jgi:hypothetical protein
MCVRSSKLDRAVECYPGFTFDTNPYLESSKNVAECLKKSETMRMSPKRFAETLEIAQHTRDLFLKVTRIVTFRV